MPPTKFQVNWSFSSGEETKIDFQDGHLGFQIGMILAIYDLKVTQKLPTKFQVNWPFGSGEEAKNRFLGFPIGRILAIFDPHITPMLPTKFQLNWPFGSGEEMKKRFLRWRPWQPSRISNQNYLSYF